MQSDLPAYWQRIRQYSLPLICSLIAHFLLFLILTKFTSGLLTTDELRSPHAKERAISVSLQKVVQAQEEIERAPELEPESEIDPVEPAKPVPAAAPIAESQLKQPVVSDQRNDNKPEKAVTTRLVTSEDLRSHVLLLVQDNAKKETVRTLGKLSSQELPSNWTHKALVYTPGMLSQATRYSKIVILDSWNNMDGTLNSRVRLPNGKTVCGMQKPQDPFEFLSVQIWRYRSC